MEKLAFIEINEIGTRLTIVNSSNGKYKLVKEDIDKFDLFKEITEDKLLKPKTISSLLAIFKMYKKIVDDYGIEKVVAVASEFLLKARNQKGFLDEVYNNTNITFSYISGDDYIKNFYASVVNSIDVSKGYAFNIGVNNVSIIRYNRRSVLASTYIPFGFMSAIYKENGEKRSYNEIVEYAIEQFKECDFEFPLDEEISCVVCGEPFINVGRVAKKLDRYPLNIDNNYPISKETFDKVEKFVTELDLEKIKRVKGIIADSTDCLLSGFAIASAIYKYYGIKDATISTANEEDGIIRNFIGVENFDRYSDLLANSFDFYREFMPFDTEVNLRVNNMSNILFKQLKVMHKLPRNYVKPLRVAAYMFNCGKIVSCEEYERHGFYIVLNANLAGVSQKDILLAAFTCLCQNPENFNLSEWIKYQSIVTEEDMDAVRKMGVIIKLAASLNSSKNPVVTDIVCDMLGDSVIMKTVSNEDAGYEVIQGQKIADDYRKLFKKNLQLI